MTRPSPPPPVPGLRALTALLLAVAALPAQALEFDEGRAYGRDDGRLLYIEQHHLWTDAGGDHRLVLYRCPDGTPFARKVVDYRGAPTAPDFDFEDGRDGYREGVRTTGGGREVFFRADRDAGPVVRPLPATAAEPVIDAGFDEMVRREWPRLDAGGHIERPFLIPSRFAFLAVRVDVDADDGTGDAALRRLRMRVDRWFGFLVPPIELTYARRERRLLEFAGIGTIRADDGAHLDVRIVFPRSPPPAPAGALAQARAVALARSCAPA